MITNGIETLSLLSQNRIPAYSTGGEVSAENPAVLAGGYAEDGVRNFFADIVFFSARALDTEGRIYDCFENEIFLRRAMIQHSKTKVFLCDDTKFGKTSPHLLCTLNDVDYVASNRPLPDFIPASKSLSLFD